MNDWIRSLRNWVKTAVLCAVAIGIVYVCRSVNDDPANPRGAEPTVRRDVDARVDRAKAELARVTAKYGKGGKLSVLAWLRPEVALPPALALLEEELAEFGIKHDEQIAAIEADPAKFRVAVPGHWRQRFLLLTPEQEKALGDRIEREIEGSGLVYHDPADEARVRRIAERLWKQLPEGTPHRIGLIRDDTVNAFCLANGKIYLHSGLLARIGSDDVLAFVIAHEYAHYLARHGNEIATKIILAEAGSVLVEHKTTKLETEGKRWRAILLSAGYAGGSYVGAFLPFSRKMESEADTLGIRLMAQAGFDPGGAIAFFEQMSQNSRDPGWERFLSDHPTDLKRLKHMRKECAKLKGAAHPRR